MNNQHPKYQSTIPDSKSRQTIIYHKNQHEPKNKSKQAQLSTDIAAATVAKVLLRGADLSDQTSFKEKPKTTLLKPN